jgi:hypothetical protein
MSRNHNSNGRKYYKKKFKPKPPVKLNRHGLPIDDRRHGHQSTGLFPAEDEIEKEMLRKKSLGVE